METMARLKRFTARMNYKTIVDSLPHFDDEQLAELMHDINCIKTVERIADAAYKYVENHVDEESNDDGDLSDEQDALEVDNARRAREL
jgi:hypothetical protein